MGAATHIFDLDAAADRVAGLLDVGRVPQSFVVGRGLRAPSAGSSQGSPCSAGTAIASPLT